MQYWNHMHRPSDEIHHTPWPTFSLLCTFRTYRSKIGSWWIFTGKTYLGSIWSNICYNSIHAITTCKGRHDLLYCLSKILRLGLKSVALNALESSQRPSDNPMVGTRTLLHALLSAWHAIRRGAKCLLFRGLPQKSWRRTDVVMVRCGGKEWFSEGSHENCPKYYYCTNVCTNQHNEENVSRS